MRDFWKRGEHQPLVSRPTIQELIRVLAYPKFRLNEDEIKALLSDYLPYAETVELPGPLIDLPRGRDEHDQMFIELAVAGKADLLVSGDADLLAMADSCPFAIESPAEFHQRINAN